MIEVTIPLRSHEEAVHVLGPYDRHAKLLRQELEIEVYTRGGNLRLKGGDEGVQEARRRIEHLLGKLRKGRELAIDEVEAILHGRTGDPRRPGVPARTDAGFERSSGLQGGNGVTPGSQRAPHRSAVAPVRAVGPRSQNQRRYLEAIESNALVFGLGVAGTGKTYLSVWAAVRALRAGECRRLVITRPVVEAGESLGFLPGDVQAKLNPYMRPIYDALYDILPFEDVARLEEAGVIEVAPLAYMRGRTLAHSFVILDEGQNTTVPQMKMFLTRMGEGSRMVVTGDPTQSDLPDSKPSGLLDAAQRLRGFAGVKVVEFSAKDIVRHPLVEQIVRAYEAPPRAEPRRSN